MQIFPVKVINLARSINRRAEFVNNNPRLRYEFFPAVDGAQLSDEIIQDPSLFQHPLHFKSLGVFGCALSHLNLWNEVIATGIPMTVVEDDAIFRDDFLSENQRVISRLPLDWDIVLWGWNTNSVVSLSFLPEISPAVCFFDHGAICEQLGRFRGRRDSSFPLRLNHCFGTVAYSISPVGARKFKSGCFPMSNFDLYVPGLEGVLPNTGIDVAMCRVYPQANAFVAWPPLVVTRVGDSTL